MKKKITKLVLLIFIILVSGITPAYAEDKLNIESDSYNNETSSSYMSVLDIYKIKLFNNKTSSKKEQLKNEKEQARKSLSDGMFLTDNIKDSGSEFTEKVENYKLFVKVKNKEKIKYNNYRTNNITLIIVSIILLCLVTASVTRIYYIKKNKGDKGEYNNYA